MNLNKLAIKASAVLALVVLSACGGGGGGGGSTGGGGAPPVDSSDVIRYPYETVYGDACRSSSETIPGCTFVRATGQRVTVSADPNYNNAGYGSDDLWYVKFDGAGRAAVYNEFQEFQYYASASEFAGYIGGTTIGVGTTGAFWENVSGKTYWFGKNGVLFSAEVNAANYGQAINNKDATKAGDNDTFAQKSDANADFIQAGAEKLMKYGLKEEKAIAVASSLQLFGMGADRGYVTENDVKSAFETTFGQSFRQGIAAFQSLATGDLDEARKFNQRTASALEIKPERSA